MINLYLAHSGSESDELVGTINEDQLQFLVDQLEEEAAEDQDYAVTPMTIEYLESQGASNDLLELLRKAVGVQEEVLLRWSEA
ncbi:MAG: galactosyldiacylglycerol synthase [Chloroflexota bacterium]